MEASAGLHAVPDSPAEGKRDRLRTAPCTPADTPFPCDSHRRAGRPRHVCELQYSRQHAFLLLAKSTCVPVPFSEHPRGLPHRARHPRSTADLAPGAQRTSAGAFCRSVGGAGSSPSILGSCSPRLGRACGAGSVPSSQQQHRQPTSAGPFSPTRRRQHTAWGGQPPAGPAHCRARPRPRPQPAAVALHPAPTACKAVT